jgi:ubiquinone biosynthesis protein UbiJ
VTFGSFLETLRDRVVHRSQIGKRKLDRTGVRRRLDEANRILGERFRALVRTGRVEVPADLAGFVDAVRALEDQLAAVDRRLKELQEEHLKEHQPSTT